MNATENRPYELALQLCESGFSVIPSGGGEKHKAPLYPWTEYQARRSAKRELDNWQFKDNPQLWGIVTGAVSGIVVLDADTPEARLQLTKELGCDPHIITPREGGHWYFKHPGKPVKTTVGIIPDVDVRADGGFVNTVGKRIDGEYIIINLPESGNLLPWELLPERIRKHLNGSKPLPIPATNEPIAEGQRNGTLARIGGSLRRAGMSPEAIEAALQITNLERCQPPLQSAEVSNISKSVGRYPPDTGDNKEIISYYPFSSDSESQRDKSVTKSVTTEGIEAWVKETNGWFSYEEIDKEFEIRDSAGKANRRQIIKRLRDNGVIEAHPRNNKLFRYINIITRLIDLKVATKRTPMDIKYPFGIETYFNTYPGNIIALAGAADAGKTAFLLNFVKLNMYDFSIYYQSSEMGDAELYSRIEKFECEPPEDWNFVPEERSKDFADVIRPDCINIIDYMELAGDFYALADYLRQIHDKLAGGIAIIALQKKRNAELGRGGDFGLEKPRLYLTMDKGKITIQKAKNWADPANNPNGLILNFKIVAGCKLIVTEDWHKVEGE